MVGDAEESEFPVVVLCARCGTPDCTGCSAHEARVPGAPSWENVEGSSFREFWRTAHRSVIDAEVFFATLPDGRLGRALVFAFTCELLAVTSLVIAWALVLSAAAPSLVHDLWRDAEIRELWIGAGLFSIPAFAVVMVLLHLVWGAGVELGLRLQGAPSRVSHALRYALYACGWDLLTSPFGFAAASVSSGTRQALSDVRAAVRVPRLATHAFLTQARRVDDDTARRAVWAAAVITGTVVVCAATSGVVATLSAALLI